MDMKTMTTEQKTEFNKGLRRGRRNQEQGGGYGATRREQDLGNEHPDLYKAWSAGWEKGNTTTTRIELLLA
jgi:hypothetical protein